MVDLRRERLVDPDFVFARRLPLLEGRIVEEGKADSALDLERARTVQKDRGGMRVDATHVGVPYGVGQKGENALLDGALVGVDIGHLTDAFSEGVRFPDLVMKPAVTVTGTTPQRQGFVRFGAWSKPHWLRRAGMQWSRF